MSNQLSSTDHARILYRDALTALKNLREAQRLYVHTVERHEATMRQTLRLLPDESLSAGAKRLASLRADSDDNLKTARGRTEFYTQQVQMYALAYLMEVDYSQRFGD